GGRGSAPVPADGAALEIDGAAAGRLEQGGIAEVVVDLQLAARARLHQSASEVLDDRAGRKPEDSARRVVGVDGAAIVEVEIADESRADDAVGDVVELIGG